MSSCTGDESRGVIHELAYPHGTRRAPLAFSQVAYWNFYRISARPAVRQIASATRLRGRLKVEALEIAVREIVRRHDALRTRFVVSNGVPLQEVAEWVNLRVEQDDLTSLPETARDREVDRLIRESILAPVDVAVGPLLEVRLLVLRDDEHLLVITMAHLISDGISRSIFLRELFTAYEQAASGLPISLPAVSLQFTEYAARQRASEDEWAERHIAYWRERLAGHVRLRFPKDQALAAATGWDTVSLRLDRAMKARLREWCKANRTTLAMAVFTAYVGLVLRWCGASEAVIQYEVDGRHHAEVEGTIGYFASALYLRIRLDDSDSFASLLRRVTQEYCLAHEHADSSRFAALVPRPEVTRNPLFNWVPQGAWTERLTLQGGTEPIACSPLSFAHPMPEGLEADNEPAVLFYDFEDEVAGNIYYHRSGFSKSLMETFVRNLLHFIETLLQQPTQRVEQILLLS